MTEQRLVVAMELVDEEVRVVKEREGRGKEFGDPSSRKWKRGREMTLTLRMSWVSRRPYEEGNIGGWMGIDGNHRK